MFYPSDDVANIQGRNLDYTLVLDGDTGVVKNSLSKLMDVAAAHPNRAIIQPSIDITAGPADSLFMHLDSVRQKIFEPVSLAFTYMMGRCGFFGKGLLKNDLYILTMLGDPITKEPSERVPIDVLSHDTYEAAALCPLYVKGTCSLNNLLFHVPVTCISFDFSQPISLNHTRCTTLGRALRKLCYMGYTRG